MDLVYRTLLRRDGIHGVPGVFHPVDDGTPVKLSCHMTAGGIFLRQGILADSRCARCFGSTDTIRLFRQNRLPNDEPVRLLLQLGSNSGDVSALKTCGFKLVFTGHPFS